jgi:hypothetical protein
MGDIKTTAMRYGAVGIHSVEGAQNTPDAEKRIFLKMGSLLLSIFISAGIGVAPLRFRGALRDSDVWGSTIL